MSKVRLLYIVRTVGFEFSSTVVELLECVDFFRSESLYELHLGLKLSTSSNRGIEPFP